MIKREKLSIRDIAREANVSPATVSRVLNNNDVVKEETRSHVQHIIDKHHYKPNELARGLFINRTKSIGVIMPDITNHFFAKLFLEIEKAAIGYDQSVFLCNTLSDYSLENFYTERLSEKQVDGMLLLGGHANETKTNPAYIELLKREVYPTPLVIINGKLDDYDGNYASVSSDEYKAMYQAVSYLMDLGHKKIAFLGGKRGITSTDIKIQALNDAKAHYDFEMKNQWIITSSYDYLGGVEAITKLLQLHDKPTAIISVNDEVATGIINTCMNKGYGIPEDFSVLGFDNSFIAVTARPSITTLSHDYKNLGKISVTFLNDMISENFTADAPHTSLKMKLIQRNSCKSI